MIGDTTKYVFETLDSHDVQLLRNTIVSCSLIVVFVTVGFIKFVTLLFYMSIIVVTSFFAWLATLDRTKKAAVLLRLHSVLQCIINRCVRQQLHEMDAASDTDEEENLIPGASKQGQGGKSPSATSVRTNKRDSRSGGNRVEVEDDETPDKSEDQSPRSKNIREEFTLSGDRDRDREGDGDVALSRIYKVRGEDPDIGEEYTGPTPKYAAGISVTDQLMIDQDTVKQSSFDPKTKERGAPVVRLVDLEDVFKE